MECSWPLAAGARIGYTVEGGVAEVEECVRIREAQMDAFYKCKVCGRDHRSGIQFGSRQALDIVTMQGCKCQCPVTGQMVSVEKEDLQFLDEVHFLVIPDNGEYSALCYEYNVAACGGTREEAAKNLAGAVNDYLRYLADEGRLDQARRPASSELLVEFLGLSPTPGEGATQEGEAARDGLLESAGVKDYRFTPPPSGTKGTGTYYPVQIRMRGGSLCPVAG